MNLKKRILRAVNGSDTDMLALLEQFEPLLNKYARKLNTEDGYEDLRLRFLIVIYALANKPAIVNDGQIVDYVATSIRREYAMQRDKKRMEEVHRFGLSESVEALDRMLENGNPATDDTFFAEWEDVLACLKKRERDVLLGIYFHGYTVFDLAKQYGCTRQNINQIKQRALKKLRELLSEK